MQSLRECRVLVQSLRVQSFSSEFNECRVLVQSFSAEFKSAEF